MLWFFLLILLLKNPVFGFEATASANVVINKFQSDPPMTGMKEWVELFNTTESEIDLNGYQLSDFDNHNKILSGKIAAKGFVKHEENSGWLNNPGDSIILKIGGTIVDEVKYTVTTKKVTVNDKIISELYLDLKGKWLGRSVEGGDEWKIFLDTESPVNGEINYFDGYKTVVENVGITIIPATDSSGIGTTAIITKFANLSNNTCNEFVTDVGSSLVDGRCYKYEYMVTDGVGNTAIFNSNSTVKYDTSKPIFVFNNAFRNKLKLKSEFGGVDPESGIFKYKYSLNNLNCGSTIVPTDWSYIYNSILNIGYSGEPISLYGKSINNALLESEINCIDFVIDAMTPRIIKEIYPTNGLYKIGDKLIFSFEFNENIETTGNNYLIKLNTNTAKLINKIGNILNFEYEVLENDLTDNLTIGETKIELNGGGVFDLAGNEADLTINNLDNGIIIDGVVPQIYLIGSSYVEIPQFEKYLDLGVTVSDGEIVVENKVETNVGGIYEVNYLVTDEAGNESNTTRKVKVIDTTAPVMKITSQDHFEFNIESNEEGYLEWIGKCEGINNNLVAGDNLIKIKNVGDGVYDNCEIRAWDKWGNVGNWEKLDSFVIDTTAPIIIFGLPTLENNSFTNSNETEVAINANEKLKNCNLEKEKLLSGDFETGNIDGWNGDWVADDLHFAQGNWSVKSPDLINEDLVEKSIWQKINMESNGILSFWWRVSSEQDWDYLKFYIDGVLVNKISGEVGWQEIKHNLTIGEHTIKFTYSKDYSSKSGEDAGWIDNVKLEGGGGATLMPAINNTASTKLNNLVGGSTKYKVDCMDLSDNKSETIERIVIKESDKTVIIIPTPTPYSIFKTSAIVPTIKTVKPTAVKAIAKKSPAVLGIATTPTPNLTISPPPTTKLKSNTPWGEIKFWTMGMMVLSGTSGVVLLDKKII